MVSQILPPKGKLQKLKYQEKKKILCDQMLKHHQLIPTNVESKFTGKT